MALGVWSWANRVLGTSPVLPPLTTPYKDWDALVEKVIALKRQAVEKIGREPKTIVFGALGRCGSGAVHIANRLEIPEENIAKWDINETKEGGPFSVINDYDVMINCIYLASKIPPFLTLETINNPSRTLSVVVDVSCDATNPNNPLPIYTTFTTFDDPIVRILPDADKPIDIISIDHLPSLVPSESSREFAGLMIEHLRKFAETDVWKRSHDLFFQNLRKYNLLE